MTRDRQQTEQHLIDAVGAVLVRDGMAKLSVSSIAAEAGVDKALIYKYFKSLDHLFERYVETADLWWRAEELVAGLNRQPDNIDHSAVFRIILIRYLNALRRRPAALAILAGELNNINKLTEYFTEIREIETKRLMGLVATRFSVPAGGVEFSRFVIAVNAMTYFILLSQKIRKPIYGIDIMKGEAGWAHFEVLLLRAIENSTAPMMAEHSAVPSAA